MQANGISISIYAILLPKMDFLSDILDMRYKYSIKMWNLIISESINVIHKWAGPTNYG